MKLRLLLVGTALTFGLSVSSFAANTLGFVDMQNVFMHASKVKKMNATLEKQFAARKLALQKIEQSLQTKIAKLEKDKAVMSKKNMDKLKTSIQTQGNQLREKQIQLQQDVMAAQSKAMKTLIANVEMVIQNVATQKHLNLVLAKQSVLYSNGVDITQDVLKKMQ